MSLLDQQFQDKDVDAKGLEDVPLGKQDYAYMFELQNLPQKLEDMPQANNKYNGCLYTTNGDMVCPKGDKNAWTVTKDGYSVSH
jgi:hypothetical protein